MTTIASVINRTGFQKFSFFAVALALLLFGASYVVVCTIKYFYRRELALRLHPLGDSPIIRSGNPNGFRILFLGDSRAAEWPPLPLDRFLSINAGVPAETSAQTLLRTSQIISIEHPDIIIIQTGINDLKSIGLMIKQHDEIERECVRNIHEIVELCRKQNVQIVLTLIIPPGEISLLRRPFWSDQIDTALVKVNNILVTDFSRGSGLVILDVEQSLRSRNPLGKQVSLYRDDLHLSRDAYEKILPDLLSRLGEFIDKNQNLRQPQSSNSL